MQFISSLDNLSPFLIWGLFPRLLGVVYFIAIASLFHQVTPIAGSRGMAPIKPQLQKIRADYPGFRRFLYFPTLLWLKADDWFLRLLLATGVVASLWVVYGGPGAKPSLLLCWLIYLSFNYALSLFYPWDCLLLEAGFLALFLPPLNALPDLSAAALPLPAVGWAYRWLLFRLVLGFGKYKFLKTNAKEMGYLKPFLASMPLPNPLGWYAHRLPDWFHKLGLVFLFLIEIPIPFLIFVGGDARIVAALAIVSLMVVIQLTGNWGHFNVLAIVLCVTLLDSQASIFDQGLSGLFYPWDNLVTHVVMLILFIGGLVHFPFNSWCAQGWVYWPSFLKVQSAWVRGILGFYRALAPFRIIHPYGVFPPSSGPSVKWVPIIEGTQDGKEWKEYHYRFMPSSASSPPVFVAPYHPRLDHGIFYESFGTDTSNFLASTFGVGNPYHFSRSSPMDRLVQRLLEGDSPVVKLFSHNPFPDSPPVAVRVNLYAFWPTSHEERMRTGAWWRRKYSGPHLPPVGLNNRVWEEWLPVPELFHWDDLIWKRRSPKMKVLTERARAEVHPESIVADAPAGVTEEDIRIFWSRFVACAAPEEKLDWRNLPSVVQRARESFTPDQLRVFEKILGRFSLILLARLEPYYFGKQEPQIKVETLFHLGMLIHHIIGEGKETYEAVFAAPARAATFTSEMKTETGLFFTGIFWLEKLAFHASKNRLLLKFYEFGYEPGLSGFLTLIPFLREQLGDPYEEHFPIFARRITDGGWFTVEESA